MRINFEIFSFVFRPSPPSKFFTFRRNFLPQLYNSSVRLYFHSFYVFHIYMHHSNIIPMYPSTVKSTNIFGRYLIDFPLELRRNHFPVKAFKGEMILTEFGAVNFSAGCQFFFRDSFSCSGFHKPNMKILQGWLLVLKLPVGKEKKKKFNQARLVGKLVIEQPQSAISVSLPPTGNFDSKHQIISKR